MKGNCLERMNEIPDGSVDMILTDPPYGTTACKWDSVIDLELMWKQLKRIIKPNGAIVMTAAQPFTSILTCSNLSMFRYDMVYDKPAGTGFLNAKKMPLRCHENILVFYKALPTYNPQMTHGHARRTSKRKGSNSECYNKSFTKTSYDSTTRYPRSIQRFSSDKQRESYHPTQKPVLMMEYYVKTYSNECDLVLDFTMGSGTTGVACINTGRNFIGIERDDKYFDVAENRIMGEMTDEQLFEYYS
ncbi:MAG: site-specific DNA-methyltransferase [candidate division Zixibacteria bacterium]|nr:site-specific DNA-methyltransferase [candidate division Zixibacteria bacterium]